MTGAHTRALVAEVRHRGLRRDTGPPPEPAPDAGTHFVVLVKPEVLTATGAADAMAEVVRVLGEGDATVLRCALMPAGDFGRRGCPLLHYPRLHRVAADGVRALCSGARRELGVLTGASGTAGVLGAFEAMTYEWELSPATLEDRCRR
ncbi:hypothetical protein ACWF94_25365, partial [Streptomyces sp. NPDC055078]